jgi:hypothetical protein
VPSARRMNLNDDVVYRCRRLGPLPQLHPGSFPRPGPSQRLPSCEFILALNIKGAVFPERLDALSGDLPALIEINASSVHPQLQRLN